MDLDEQIRSLAESHETFVRALLAKDHHLIILAYTNYVRRLALILEDFTITNG
jgi:hypothetical protein